MLMFIRVELVCPDKVEEKLPSINYYSDMKKRGVCNSLSTQHLLNYFFLSVIAERITIMTYLKSQEYTRIGENYFCLHKIEMKFCKFHDI